MTEPSGPESQAQPDDRPSKLVVFAVTVYILYLIVVFSVFFAVSNRDIQIAAYVQASPNWSVETPNAIRAVFMNAPTGRSFDRGDVVMRYDDQKISPPIPRHGHIHATLSPKNLGQHPFEISFTPPADEPYVVEAQVATVATKSAKRVAFSGRREEKEKKQTLVVGWEGELRVHVLPNGAELARGLKNTIYLVVVDTNDLPVQATIALAEVEGIVDGDLAKEVRTDGLGLVRIDLTPTSNLRLSLRVEEKQGTRTGTGKVNIFTAPAQMKIQPKSLIVPANSSVEGAVETLHRSGALYVDVYENGVWSVADVFGIRRTGTGFRMKVAEPKADYVKVQVYHSLFGQKNAWDVAHYAIGDPHRCGDVLSRLVKTAEFQSRGTAVGRWVKNASAVPLFQSNQSDVSCRRWLHAMLLAIPAEFTPAPILINSQQEDRAELDAWREGVQNDLKIATAVALVAGFVVVFLVVIRGVLRSREQERLFREVDAELEEGEVLKVGGFEQYLVWMSVAIVLVTLGMFAASMMMLLNFM